jgi:DNA-binding NarL/FixJ family response regulator
MVRLLIVAEPGRLRDGLQTLLDSFRALQPAVVLDDGRSALLAIQNGWPNLVILDYHVFGETTPEFVRAIKQARGRAYCVVVAHRLAQFQPILDSGADQVLLEGFSAAELSRAVEQALAHIQDSEASTEVTE